jgi:hypothetical protein
VRQWCRTPGVARKSAEAARNNPVANHQRQPGVLLYGSCYPPKEPPQRTAKKMPMAFRRQPPRASHRSRSHSRGRGRGLCTAGESGRDPGGGQRPAPSSPFPRVCVCEVRVKCESAHRQRTAHCFLGDAHGRADDDGEETLRRLRTRSPAP